LEQEDFSIFDDCFRRLDFAVNGITELALVKILQCDTAVTMSHMRDVFRGYSRIHMTGDSLLEQQCIGPCASGLAPNSTKEMVAQVEDTSALCGRTRSRMARIMEQQGQ
jgi:hypothetical protein